MIIIVNVTEDVRAWLWIEFLVFHHRRNQEGAVGAGAAPGRAMKHFWT